MSLGGLPFGVYAIAQNFNIPLQGQWTLEVKALLSDIDEATVSAKIPVK